MQKNKKRLSFFVLLVLLFQMFSPITQVFAASTLTAPTNLRYTLSGIDNATLRWDAVTGASAYRVYEVKNGENLFISQTTNLNRYLPSLSEGTHTYTVTAINSTGESPFQTPLDIVIDLPEMQPPNGLVSSIENVNDIKLKWNQVEFATGYNIYEIKNGQRVLQATTSTQLTKYFINVSEGEHLYEVTSYNDKYGESTASSTLVNVTFPKMIAPTDLSYTISDANNILLRWKEVPYATSYNVYQIIDGKRTFLSETANLNKYLPNVGNGENIYEVTSSSTRFGESKEGSKAVINIVYPKMLPPDSVTTYFYKGNDVHLLWSSAAYADQYKLYQIVDGEKVLISNSSDRSYYFTNLPEGDYTFEIVSESNRFGESSPKDYNFTVVFPEMQAPVATISMDNATNAIIRWAPIPYATEYEVYELVNGEPVLINTTTGFSRYISNLEQGKHEYVVQAKSDRFGKSPFSNVIRADVAPVLPAPQPNKPEVKGDSVTLTWEPVEEAEEYNVYEEVDGERVLVGKTTEPTITVDTPEKEGTHEFIIVPVTKDGTESIDYATVEVEIDKPSDVTAPVTVAETNEKWSKEDVSVKLTATDDVSGVKATYYSIDHGEFVEGTDLTITKEGIHTVSFYSVDNAGNVEEVKTVDVKIDKQAPETVINTSTYWYNNGVNVELTAIDNLSGVKATYYSVNDSEFVEGTSFTLEKEGIHKVSFYSVDNVGNVEDVRTVEVKIDKEAPVTTSTVNDENTVELTAVDQLSGVHTTYYSINGSDFKEGTSFAVDQAGVNKITFYSIDNAGNMEPKQTIEVIVDKTAPVTVSNVEEKWNTVAVNVELTATDDLSGVKATYYSVDGAEFTEGTSFIIEKEGIHTLTFYSVDNAGNIEDQNTVEVKVDKTAPVTVSNLEEKWNTAAVNVELTATDDLSGVKATYYSIDGAEFTEGTSFTIEKEGIHTLTFYSVDNAGNIEDKNTVEVKVDKTAPVTVSNVEEKWNTAAVNVELTATDDLSGVKATYYSIDGAEFTEGTSFTIEKEGIHTLTFYSVDNAGNIEDQNTVEVKVDKTSPVTVSNVKDKWNTATVNVELTATDDLSGVKATYYSIDGAEFTEGTNFTVEKEGIHTVTFYSVDNAGNIEEKHTADVKIDQTAPTIKANFPTEIALGTSVSLNYEAADNLSGIKESFVEVNGVKNTTGKVTFDQPGLNKIKITAIDNAGLKTVVEKAVSIYIQATIEVTPKVINLNNGEFTVRATLPKGYSFTSVDLSTVTINDVHALNNSKGLENQAKKGQFKFERDDFAWDEKEELLVFRAIVDGVLVVGSTTVEVINNQNKGGKK